MRNNLGYNFIKKKEYWEEQIDKDENFLKEIEDEIEQEKQNETQAQKDFKAEYTTWFQGLLKTDEGKKELIAFRLNKEVRAVLVKVLN